MTEDRCVTIVPYFRAHPGMLDALRALLPQLVERTKNEEGCLFYAFTTCENLVHCREGYSDGQAATTHLENVAPLLEKMLKLADLERLEVHGPSEEIEKLRSHLRDLNPDYFALELGFRK